MAILALIIWIVVAIIIGSCANSRGRSFLLWFMISIIIGPVFGAILYNIVVRSK